MTRFLKLLILCCFPMAVWAQDANVRTGAERTDVYLPLLKGKRVGMLVNQTAMVRPGVHLVDSLLALKVNIVKIFSPEHGFRGMADAGEKVGNSRDERTGLPIVSLYGKHRQADAADLADVDILVFDVQDVGTRFYTYISTLQELMESAAKFGKPLIVLDRPNPNGHYIDGPVLDTNYRSFVGMQPIPTVHGMTVAEYAQMLNGEGWLAGKVRCRLTVVPCENYDHTTMYQLPVKPSPNLPNMRSIYLYASTCLFEGTVFSLGRGTDKPFQVYGHPLLPKNLFSFTPKSVPGAKSPVLMDSTCYGFDLTTIDPKADEIDLSFILNAYQLFPEKARFFNNFFDKLAGSDVLRKQIQQGLSAEAIRKSWEPGLNRFASIRKKYLLYTDF
ncbi:exo-beta-N-acetylmuramidase NamZ family protein [Chitinophaga sp. NPDC101104]|uniref:exo-beta-N-acetylmuramidase NamZ family protein n=1 Tax=Chitinophaga sp. NPDC101104 TaxID=3390561 RepID=UPI003D02F187